MIGGGGENASVLPIYIFQCLSYKMFSKLTKKGGGGGGEGGGWRRLISPPPINDNFVLGHSHNNLRQLFYEHEFDMSF